MAHGICHSDNSTNDGRHDEGQPELPGTNPGAHPGGEFQIPHSHAAQKARQAEQQKRQAESGKASSETRPPTGYRRNDHAGQKER